MMYFLVKGAISIRHYMADNSDEEQVSHLVQADSRQEAGEKFKAFYEAKSNEYSVYYSVRDFEVMETIL